MKLKPGKLIDRAKGIQLGPNDLKRRILARAETMKTLGVRESQGVVLLHGNSYTFLIDLFAIWHLGGYAVPLDPKTTPYETERVVQHSNAVLLTGASATYETCTPYLPWQEDIDSGALASACELRDCPSTERALVLYTSGTTGNPKGVVHTHGTLQARLQALASHIPAKDLERSLCVLPLQFGHGLIGNSLLTWHQSGELILWGASFDIVSAAQLGDAIDQYGITFLSSVPAVWESSLPVSLPPKLNTLRRIHCASAPSRPTLWQEIRAWCGENATIKNVYGITEAGSWIAGTEGKTPPSVPGLVGKPWGVEFDFRDGEIWIKTNSLMPGYLHRDDLTQEVMREEWFNTGDAGSLDPAGNLILQGRTRTTINRAGIKIYPEEIDQLLKSHPNVKDACAFGIPDEIAGQTLAAAIVFRDAQIEFQQLEDWCRQHASQYKIPVRWYSLDKIPLTDRGKVSRAQVADLCISQGLPQDGLCTT
jgi:acyl-CoA synthetase (AMP-forming)/AMP-acid ligase II